MTYASEWLVELDAHTGAEVVTLRYSVNGYVTGPADTPSHAVYEARISGISPFARHMASEGRTMGAMTVEAGGLTLSNADGKLDQIKDWGFDGQPFVLKRLPYPRAPYATAETVLTGTSERLDSDSGMLSFRLTFYDRRRDLDIPIQEDSYGGTTISGEAGGADGTADQKGILKPLSYGYNRNVAGVLADPFNMVIQVHDGPIDAVEAFDGGVPLINDGDVATLAELEAATGNPGRYKTWLAGGCWRPFGTNRGRPTYVWTANVTEGATPEDRRAGAIALRMLARRDITGAGNINAASFAALDALAPAELGIHIDSETTVLAATKAVLDSIGATIIPNALGQFEVERFGLPGIPVAEIVEPDILVGSASDTVEFVKNPDTDGGVPTHRVQIKYGRVWRVHGDTDIGSCVSEADPTRAEALRQEYREERADDPAVLTKHLLSQPLEIETLLRAEGAAAVEAARLLALYGVSRDVVTIALDRGEAVPMVLNATVSLRLDRLGYELGKPMVIIGRADDPATDKAILTLWG